jgi:hypothetical protein
MRSLPWAKHGESIMTGKDQNSAPLVERAKNIILTPSREWEVIDGEVETIGSIYRQHVLPLAAIPAVAGLIGATLFGYSAFGFSYRPSIGAAAATAVFQYGAVLIGVFVLALIIDALAPHFGATPNRTQAFKVAAYSATASWVAGIFNILPALSFLSILGLYSLYLLYLGLPKLMRAPKDKAMTYTLVVVIAAIAVALVMGAILGPISGLFAPGL